MRKAVLVSALLGGLLSQTSCSGSRDELIGNWVIEMEFGGKTYLEFNENGSLLEKSDIVKYNRTWTTEEENLCIKTSEEDGGFETCGEYIIKGDKLTWTALGNQFEYTKLKK